MLNGLETSVVSVLVSVLYSNWFWSRPRSYEVLVSVSYVLVSWSQIDDLFFSIMTSDCVMLKLVSGHYE